MLIYINLILRKSSYVIHIGRRSFHRKLQKNQQNYSLLMVFSAVTSFRKEQTHECTYDFPCLARIAHFIRNKNPEKTLIKCMASQHHSREKISYQKVITIDVDPKYEWVKQPVADWCFIKHDVMTRELLLIVFD